MVMLPSPRPSVWRVLSIWCTIAAVALAGDLAWASDSPETLRYTVTISENSRSTAKVKCTMTVDGTRNLFMNNNGAPRLPGGHAAFVKNIKAVDEQGQKVVVDDTGQARWRLTARGKKAITLTYDVLIGDDESVWPYGPDEAPYVTDDGVFWTGRALFITTNAEDITVKFDLATGWRTSTPWNETHGSPHTFLVEDDEQLVDSFLFAGTHIEKRVNAGKTEVVLVIGNPMAGSANVMDSTINEVLRAYSDLFDGNPAGRALVVANLYETRGGFDGGVFGKSVSVLMSDPPRKSNRERWAPFIAHELLHLWNGQAIEYAKQEYWFSEGFTDYYANVICARLGVIGETGFIRRTTRACESYLQSWGSVSIREAGGSKRHNNDLVYAGGSLVGLALDVRIRKLTKGARSLDDVMRRMYSDFGATGDKYDIEDVIRLTNDVAGDDQSQFFRDYVMGTGELPLKETLHDLGFEFEVELGETLPSRDYVIHQLLRIQSLTQTSEGLIIRRSQDAGYLDEDNLIAVAETPVATFRDLQVVARALEPVGKVVDVTLLRGGKKVTHKLTLGKTVNHVALDRTVGVSIERMKDLDLSQQRIMRGILGRL